MDYTNYAYNEAVGRLKVMLADNSYAATPKMLGSGSTYLRNFNEDSGDNFSDNLSVGLQCLSICLHLHDLVLFCAGYRTTRLLGHFQVSVPQPEVAHEFVSSKEELHFRLHLRLEGEPGQCTSSLPQLGAGGQSCHRQCSGPGGDFQLH